MARYAEALKNRIVAKLIPWESISPGSCLGEDDIVRLEDNYRRLEKWVHQ